ncbi:MAG: S41 family peptidase [candidate division KSB1 bacterium]|nr:S41 family peptidase [candidate division KSB1 bacterium]MDZ7336612.1 S41 family peptidase [candidate division KSB1 bacterium]
MAQNVREFESAWIIAKKYYPFFEFKRMNWDSLYFVFQPAASQARGDEIYFVLYDLFAMLKDGHVEIHTEGGFPIPTYLPPRFRDQESYSPEVVRRYFHHPLKIVGENKIEYELIDHTIGYIRITTFVEGDWIRDVDRVLRYFEHTTGLIIDIRNNNGGSSLTYEYVLARLITEPVLETWYFQNGTKQSWSIQPARDFNYRERIMILINGASFSAAEIFVELIRQSPNVTVVGDTSGGGGGSSEVFHLPSGKRLKLPIKYFKRVDGEMVEWNGVIPDIVVEQTETEREQNRDKQLERAIQLLKNNP